ncbi:hypothetical protein [Halomonas sp. LBP4]|uniref:hypothetical protein n=1 Tax=Halomonas sp. LBP4 TaxID=2044917 RepID=UPI0011B7AEAB|nr:hypothetical protein [Halomonas sp. LBP4]
MTFDPVLGLSFLGVFLSLIYVFLTSTSLKNIGAFIVEAHFIIIILPAMLVLPMQDYPPKQRLTLMLSLFFGQLILKAISRLRIGTVTITKDSNLNSKVMRNFVLGLTFALLIYLIVAYFPYMKLHALDDVHSYRAQVSQAVSAPLIGYVLGFLQITAAPVLLSIGIFTRRRFLVAVAIAISLIIYMAVGAKIALAQILLTMAFAVITRQSKTLTILPLYVMFTVLLAVNAIIIALGAAERGVGLEASAVIFMRSFALQSAQIGIYYDFFLEHVNTYYSHLNIFRLILDYPYQDSLGITIGNFMGAGGKMNANAGFWATDGLAAADITGLFIIAVIFGVVIVYMKFLLPPSMTPVAACATLPFLMACANGSLFTNLLSGGGIFLMLWVRFLLKPSLSENGDSATTTGKTVDA